MKLRDFFKDLTPAKIAERDAKLKRDREMYECRMASTTPKTELKPEKGTAVVTGTGVVIEQISSSEELEANSFTRVKYPPQYLTVQDMETLFDPNRVQNCERTEKKFVIKVLPIGAPRMNRCVKWRPSPRQLRYFVFKDALRAAVGDHPVPDGIDVTAYISMADTWTKKRKAEMDGKPHRLKPDTDNIAKGIMDALWGQDCGIWDLHLRKFWCQQGQERLELTLVYYFKKKDCAPAKS